MPFHRLIVGTIAAALLVCGATVTSAGEDAELETITVFGDGQLEVPASFRRVQPKSRIIKHEFQAKAGEGDSEATARVTFMPAGGDIAANIKGWQGQFAGGDEDAIQSEETKVGQWTLYIVDVNGTFAERSGGGPFAGGRVIQREGYAMTGVIFLHPSGRKYYAKLIGPEAVVKANRQAFVKMAKGIEK